MKFKCAILFLMSMLFSTPSSAAFINTMEIHQAHGGNLILSNSFFSDIPGNISGVLGFVNVDPLIIEFTVMDLPNSPSTFILGGPGAGTGNITIQNSSGIRWTDFHIKILPQPNPVHFNSASVASATAPSTISIDDGNVNFLFASPFVSSPGSFSFSGIELVIPDNIGFASTFSISMEPTFMSEPSSPSLALAGLIAFLFIHFWSVTKKTGPRTKPAFCYAALNAPTCTHFAS
jgi:hypothetical protein